MSDPTGTRLGLLLADDSAQIRQAVASVLGMEPSIKILGEACTFKEALALAKIHKPEVVLLDLHMPDHQTFEPEYIKLQFATAGSKVLDMSLISGEDDEEFRTLAESFGAVMLLDKSRLGTELIPTILNLNQPQAE